MIFGDLQGSGVLQRVANTSKIINIDVFDTFGNHSNSVSDLFSVTDNTAPNVELVVIDQLFVGETYQIEWQAEDNLEVSHHLLYFSENSTDSFNYIDSVSGSLLMYNWVVPDFISNDARIKIEKFYLEQGNRSKHQKTGVTSIEPG